MPLINAHTIAAQLVQGDDFNRLRQDYPRDRAKAVKWMRQLEGFLSLSEDLVQRLDRHEWVDDGLIQRVQNRMQEIQDKAPKNAKGPLAKARISLSPEARFSRFQQKLSPPEPERALYIPKIDNRRGLITSMLALPIFQNPQMQILDSPSTPWVQLPTPAHTQNREHASMQGHVVLENGQTKGPQTDSISTKREMDFSSSVRFRMQKKTREIQVKEPLHPLETVGSIDLSSPITKERLRPFLQNYRQGKKLLFQAAIQGFGHESETVRMNSLVLLNYLIAFMPEEPQILEITTKAFDDESPSVKTEAENLLHSLVKLGKGHDLAAKIAAEKVYSSSPPVRDQGIRLFKELAIYAKKIDPEILFKIAEAPDAEIRIEFFQTLQEFIYQEKMLEKIARLSINAFSDENSSVRGAAKKVFEQLYLTEQLEKRSTELGPKIFQEYALDPRDQVRGAIYQFVNRMAHRGMMLDIGQELVKTGCYDSNLQVKRQVIQLIENLGIHGKEIDREALDYLALDPDPLIKYHLNSAIKKIVIHLEALEEDEELTDHLPDLIDRIETVHRRSNCWTKFLASLAALSTTALGVFGYLRKRRDLQELSIPQGPPVELDRDQIDDCGICMSDDPNKILGAVTHEPLNPENPDIGRVFHFYHTDCLNTFYRFKVNAVNAHNWDPLLDPIPNPPPACPMDERRIQYISPIILKP